MVSIVERRFPVAFIRLSGRLHAAGAARVRADLIESLAGQPAALVVDLSGIEATEDVLRSVFPVRYWPDAVVLLCAVRPEHAEALHGMPLFGTVEEALAEADRYPVPDLAHAVYLPSRDAPRHARSIVAEACRAWGVPDVMEAAQVVTSELVANGVLHARTLVDLTVSRRAARLQIAVRDGDHRRVASNGSIQFDAESGRGLTVVEALSGSWGVVQTHDGKVVWASLPC